MNFYPILERCPDCGGNAKLISKTGFLSSEITTRVICTKCGKETGNFTAKDMQEAIDRVSEAWNEQARANKPKKRTYHKRIKPELRPCYVEGKKALFHRWNKRTDILLQSKNAMSTEDLAQVATKARKSNNVPSFLYSKLVTNLYAIVEFEDGSIAEVEPESVRFCDDMANNYDFEEREDDE